MTELESTKLILFSGLAADENVFVSQMVAFPELIVPSWPIPLPSETLDAYADRLASELGPCGRAIIGGASFGGIVSLHVAQRVNPLAVVLIGSVRSPSELSRLIRLCRPFKALVPLIPVRLVQYCSALITTRLARRVFPHLSGLARQFRTADPRVFRWSLARILDWESAPVVECPVFHIHGDRDFVLPLRYTKADKIVHGGGHVISLTHSTEVNKFIKSVIAEIEAKGNIAVEMG